VRRYGIGSVVCCGTRKSGWNGLPFTRARGDSYVSRTRDSLRIWWCLRAALSALHDHGCHDPCVTHGSRQPRSWLIFYGNSNPKRIRHRNACYLVRGKKKWASAHHRIVERSSPSGRRLSTAEPHADLLRLHVFVPEKRRCRLEISCKRQRCEVIDPLCSPPGQCLTTRQSQRPRLVFTLGKNSQVSDSPEIIFLRGYKDAIMHFNMLDRNLAYCLQWASTYAGIEVDLLAVLSYSFDKKVKKIVCLIKTRGRKSEYAEFLRLAEQCRTQRNRLVHGHWEFVPRLPKPIRFQVPAPFEEEGYMTQNEFSVLVSPFLLLSSLFIKLQKKYPIAESNNAPEPTTGL
jgi:hypothetical protein